MKLAASLTPTGLRCEYRTNPVGIDVPNPRLGWTFTSPPTARGARQTAYQILVASTPQLLAADKGDLWSAVVRSGENNQIAYGGKPLRTAQVAYWKVRVKDERNQASAWSPVGGWIMGVVDEKDWNGAKWIAAPDAQQPQDTKGPKKKYETILLRRDFTVKPGLVRALINVCGLGHYEMTLNGARVGDILLAPGWTEYKKTCLYDTYDVTSMLRPGANAAGLFLGNGFFHVHAGRYHKIIDSYGAIQAIAVIRLEYANGAVENVVTDAQWKVASGPIVFSSVYGGEDYDARLAQKGWDQPGFPAKDWSPPAVLEGPGGALKGLSVSAPPVRGIETLVPIGKKEISKGVTVYDLGQNAAVMLDLKVKGPAGSSVRVTPSEILNGSGDIDDRMCGNQSYWTYILNGEGTESYSSRFYYRGGRYFRVERKPADGGGALPEIVSIEGRVIQADAPIVGKFSCSNELFNKVFELIRWAQKSNMMSVMTDCPTREKLGWLEETHLNGPALRYNFDFATLGTKITNDMFDAQRENGLIPSLVPNFGEWGEGSKYTIPLQWGSACIIVPWQQYEFTGDRSLLSQHYEGMKKYLDYLASRSRDNIVGFGLGDWYDNHGEGGPTLTPVAVTDTAFYYQNYRIMTQIATVLGEKEDTGRFEKKADEVQAAFNKKFFNEKTANYSTGSQGANCLPLAMAIVDPKYRAAVFENLLKDWQAKGTTVGEVSYQAFLQAIAEGGRSDLIYSTYNTEKEGYGLQVKLGKTSLTEAWNGGNASQNHFMFGQLNEWFYRYLAGIQGDPSGPGFRKILIKPAIVDNLEWVKATYDSIRGPITSEWSRFGSRVTLKIVIPANTTATVFVPAASAASVTERGRPVAANSSVKWVRQEKGAAVFEVGSGTYQFSSSF